MTILVPSKPVVTSGPYRIRTMLHCKYLIKTTNVGQQTLFTWWRLGLGNTNTYCITIIMLRVPMMNHIIYFYIPSISCTFFPPTVDILTDNIKKESSIKFKCPCKWCQWARMHNTRTLILKQLNGIHPFLIYSYLMLFSCDMSKCLLWKKSVNTITQRTHNTVICSL